VIDQCGDIALELPTDLLERQAIESVMDQLSDFFANGSGDRSGLYLASPNAGNATARRFWADARAVGVAFANPELFPWCLANAPCAALARRFGIRGPTFTWLGGDDALQAARSAAEVALRRGRVERAFVVSVCFGESGSTGRVRAWRLGR